MLYILKTTYLGETSSINEGLLQKGYERLSSGVKAIDILKRNGILLLIMLYQVLQISLRMQVRY